MIKHYTFNYYFLQAEVCFRVDTEKFTKEMAYATLDFYTWDYDKENDPIDEAMKKYAMEAIRIASIDLLNLEGVKNAFQKNEGFGKVDGSIGIEINFISEYEFDEEKLSMTVVID